LLSLRLAFRNIFRNARRTALTLAAIAVGCAALILNGGVIFNIFRGLREDAIFGRHGHLQIYRRGYLEGHLGDPDRYVLTDAEYARLEPVLREAPHVSRVTRRVAFSGLAQSRETTVSFLGEGVEPDDDALFNRQQTIIAGEELTPQEPYGVLLGKGLAEKVRGKPGDYLTLLAHTPDGALNAIDVRIRGVFHGGLKEYDDWTMKVPLEAAQRLLWSQRVEAVVVLLDDTAATEAVQADLLDRFAGAGLDLEIRTWKDLALFHNQVVALFRRELDVITLIVSLIVVLSIANTMTMSIFERSREIGTLRAMGARPRRIVGLFLLEGAILGALGAAAGLLIGVVVARIVSRVGITYPSPPGSTRPYLGGIDLDAAYLLFSCFLSAFATVVATAFPAVRGARLSVVDALRQ
jgi:putative ABC transport system permease protein